MAGKPQALASRRFAYALDGLSKNALADLVIDIARGCVGEDASEDLIAAHLQGFVDAVCRQREDKPVSLAGKMNHFDDLQEQYRTKTGRFRQLSEEESRHAFDQFKVKK